MDLWWREDSALTVHQIITGVERLPSLKPLCNKELSRSMMKIFEDETNLPVQNFIINLVNFAKASRLTEEFSLIPFAVAAESDTTSVMSYETMSNGGAESLSDSSTCSEIDLEEDSRIISEEELAVVSKLGTKLNTQKVLNFTAAPALISKSEASEENEEEETKSYCSIITLEEQDSNFDIDEEPVTPSAISTNEELVCIVQVEKLDELPVVAAVKEPCIIDAEAQQEDLSNGVYYHTTPNVRSIQPALPAPLQQVIQQLTPITDKSILLSGISSFVLSNAPLISNTYNKVVAEFKQSVFVNVELVDSGSKLKKQQKVQPAKFNLFEAARRIVDTISDMN